MTFQFVIEIPKGNGNQHGGACGKFVSGAKVLAAVPSISQPRRVYCELHGNKDTLEYGGEAVVSEDLNTEFWKSFFRIEILLYN